MRALRIEKGGRIFVGGQEADIRGLESKEEFLSSLLTLDVELSDDMTLSDIVHFFYEAKSLIESIFSENYEAVRAMTISSNLSREHECIRVYKSFKIEKDIDEEKEFFSMIPEIEFVASAPGEVGIKNISDLPVKIDESINLTYGETVVDASVKITLLDLMASLFDELPAYLKDGVVLS